MSFAAPTMAGHMCPAISVSGLGITLPGRVLFSDVSFDVELGEVVAIMGPSGIGKSTLLSCLAGVTRPSAGSVAVCGTNLSNLSVTERALLRQRKIGFVFQFGELLPELNVLDNVSLPLRLSGASRSVAEESARVWVKRGANGWWPLVDPSRRRGHSLSAFRGGH